jgi:hypothetical protein
MTPDPPSLTTVPDAAGGRRTFTRILIAMCLLAVGAFGFAMFKAFTHVRPAEEIARERFNWDYRFTVAKAVNEGPKAEAWFTPANPKMNPGDGVELLHSLNPVGSISVAPKPAKPSTAKPLRRVAKGLVGETFGVEYDTKRRLYHVWWQAAP